MTLLHQFGEELQEKRDDEQSDVHTIDIGIRSHNHLVVSQSVESVLDVEGSLKEIKLLILIHHLLGKSEGVEGFSAQ